MEDNGSSDSNEHHTEERAIARPDDEAMPEGSNQLVRRGFAGVDLAHEGPATQALVAKETAMIQARWIMAMRAPRNLLQVRSLLAKECKQPGFAEKAMYSVPRGGGSVKGMSIRFAEVAMRTMGNMSCEAVTIFDSEEERLIRVTATDYETNASWLRDITVKKTVERKKLRNGERPMRTRINSSGEQIFICEATDDDTRTKEAAEISKASRTAILRLVPGYIITEMRQLCETLQLDKARKDPHGELKKIVDSFADMGVLPAQLEAYLGHAMDQLVPAEITALQLLYRGLRDGDFGSWNEAMTGAEAAREKAKAAHKESVAAAAAAKKGAPAADASGAAQPATGAAQPATKPDEKPATQPADDKRTSTGKGTNKVKEQMKKDAPTPAADPAPTNTPKPEPAPPAPAPATSAPAPEPAKPEPAKPTPTFSLVSPTTTNPNGEIERDCAICGAPVMAPASMEAKDIRCDADRNM